MGVSKASAGKSAPQTARMVVLGIERPQCKQAFVPRRPCPALASAQALHKPTAFLTIRSTPTLDRAAFALPLQGVAVKRGLAQR